MLITEHVRTLIVLINIYTCINACMQKVRSPEIRKVVEDEKVKEEEIEEMVRMFLRDVKSGRWKSRGWPEYWTVYAVSKLALNAHSRILAKRLQGNISVNCFCPGFTKTCMTKGQGNHSPNHAASVAATLALLPPHLLPTSKFFLLRSSLSKL